MRLVDQWSFSCASKVEFWVLFVAFTGQRSTLTMHVAVSVK